MAVKILFTDYYYADNNQEREILNKLDAVEIIDLTKEKKGGVIEPDELIPYVADADALIVQFAKINSAVIHAMKKCRIIARYAIGLDTIDLDAARTKGITVSNVPDYCIEEVSDTAIAHIMNCFRALSEANLLIHENKWTYDAIKPLQRISASKIGLIAFGNIARRTAEKLRPFGCELLVYDPLFNNQGSFDWVSFVSLDELLSKSDVISIHAPLNDNTKHMINDDAFSRMKAGVCIVNTSRGGLIDERALIRSLDSGKIRRASLDVLDAPDSEYRFSDLLKYKEKVTITPHLGWYSETSIAELQRKVAVNVFEMLVKGRPVHKIV